MALNEIVSACFRSYAFNWTNMMWHHLIGGCKFGLIHPHPYWTYSLIDIDNLKEVKDLAEDWCFLLKLSTQWMSFEGSMRNFTHTHKKAHRGGICK